MGYSKERVEYFDEVTKLYSNFKYAVVTRKQEVGRLILVHHTTILRTYNLDSGYTLVLM